MSAQNSTSTPPTSTFAPTSSPAASSSSDPVTTSSPVPATTPSTSTADPPTSTAVPTTSSIPPVTTSSTTPVVLTTTTSSSAPEPTITSAIVPTTTSQQPTTSDVTPTTTASSPAVETTSQSDTTTSASESVNVVTITPSNGPVTTVTQTSIAAGHTGSSTSSTSSSSSSTATAIGSGSNASSGGLSTGGTIAVAVVVPIVGVALIVLAGLFFWRRRKQQKDAEDLRRKEVEEYGFNPNDDPTLPAVGGVAGASDGPLEMREDDQGYRGWGATTVAGTSGRNPSTTLSNSGGPALSEGTSPTHGPVSDTQSTNPLIGPNGRPLSGSSEGLGAMGPAAAENRGGVNRGPSNASSSYSAANRSDGSGEQAVPGGAYGQAQYYADNNYNNYGTAYGSPPSATAEIGGQPIIRDNLARRATRIENPSHFPQASAGISQNF